GVWAAPRAWGYPSAQAGIGPEVSAQFAAPWRSGFAVLQAGANGVLTTGLPDSGRVGGALAVARQSFRAAQRSVVISGVTRRGGRCGGVLGRLLIRKGVHRQPLGLRGPQGRSLLTRPLQHLGPDRRSPDHGDRDDAPDREPAPGDDQRYSGRRRPVDLAARV